MIKIIKNIVVKMFILLSVILGGITLCLLWTWFISEPFGVMKISIPQAIGIDLIITFLTAKVSDYYNEKKLEDKITEEEKCSVLIIIPLVYLFFGFIVHLFM